eukprot:m.242874 g.242874  ORF g.242874 m.242874 type:complete len:72 (-) comp38355_c0_seq1:412-627(-)
MKHWGESRPRAIISYSYNISWSKGKFCNWTCFGPLYLGKDTCETTHKPTGGKNGWVNCLLLAHATNKYRGN